MAKNDKKMVDAITSMDVDFAQWYTDICKKADLIVSRAFMPWKELLAFIKGHLNPGGQIVFLTLEELKADEDMDWTATGHASYKIGKDTRHFCAFAQKQA